MFLRIKDYLFRIDYIANIELYKEYITVITKIRTDGEFTVTRIIFSDEIEARQVFDRIINDLGDIAR